MLFSGGVFVFHIWKTISQLSITEWPEVEPEIWGQGWGDNHLQLLRALVSEARSLLFSETVDGGCSAGRWQFWSVGSPFSADRLFSLLMSYSLHHSWLQPAAFLGSVPLPLEANANSKGAAFPVATEASLCLRRSKDSKGVFSQIQCAPST